MEKSKKPNKILTFSYDDGVTQDVRLIELFDKYGMKATFNINSEMFGFNRTIVRENREVGLNRIHTEDLRHIYVGHEVAAHTLTHPFLPAIEAEDEIARQVEQDRLNLSELCGYEVVGFAYPGGGINYDSRVANIIREKTGVRYCRTTVSNHGFDVQDDLYEFKPSVHHHKEWDKLFELGEQFLSLQTDTKKVFYVWGHAYEFDIEDTWARFEEFLQMMSGKDDIAYLTNKDALL